MRISLEITVRSSSIEIWTNLFMAIKNSTCVCLCSPKVICIATPWIRPIWISRSLWHITARSFSGAKKNYHCSEKKRSQTSQDECVLLAKPLIRFTWLAFCPNIASSNMNRANFERSSFVQYVYKKNRHISRNLVHACYKTAFCFRTLIMYNYAENCNESVRLPTLYAFSLFVCEISY